MDLTTIKTEVDLLLSTLNIEATNEHYQVAENYYHEHHMLPDIQNLLDMVEQFNDGENTTDVPQLEESTEEPNQIESNFILDESSINPNILPRLMSDVKIVLSDQEVEKIKLIFVRNSNDLTGNLECLNCYDSFVETDLIRILPCNHSFHRLCIDEQLKTKSHFCPVCKKSAGKYIYVS